MSLVKRLEIRVELVFGLVRLRSGGPASARVPTDVAAFMREIPFLQVLLEDPGSFFFLKALGFELLLLEQALLLLLFVQLGLLLTEFLDLLDEFVSLVILYDFVRHAIALRYAVSQEGPSFPLFPSFLARTDALNRRRLFDNLLHDGAQVGLKLELVLLERLEHFVQVLRREQLAYRALVHRCSARERFCLFRRRVDLNLLLFFLLN